VLITPGGIGRPIDEAAVNRALFDREGVEVIGVVMNKVIPSKFDYISEFGRRGFERLGLELLGVLPQERMLSEPSMQDVCAAIRGEIISGGDLFRRHISNIMIGAMQPSNVLDRLEPRTLLVVPGDRDDVILAAHSEAENAAHEGIEGRIAGLVLSESLRPQGAIAHLIENSHLPVIASPMDSYVIASRIHSMTVKTLPGDTEKISRIQDLVSAHVNVDRILEKIAIR
jgi:BioD-like phosphotransacetylase family protein